MNLNGKEYFYIRNVQNDVIGLHDSEGKVVVNYSYDTWGNIVSITGSLKDSVGKKNPYRYRGYRYDEETGLYYLQSRYYNAEWGRFINADAVIGQPGDILSFNMFAYCHNNPVNMSDESGYLPKWLKKAAKVVKKAVSKVVKKVKDVVKKVNKSLGTIAGTIAKASNESISKVTNYFGKDRRTTEYYGKYQATEISVLKVGNKNLAKVGKVTGGIAKGVNIVEKVGLVVTIQEDLHSIDPLWNVAMTLGNFASGILAGKIIGATVVGAVTFIGLPAIVGTVVTIGASAIAGYYIGKAFDNLKRQSIDACDFGEERKFKYA